ncbi:MAG: YecH family metal-binding protein [Pseudomonadota bacterium]
MASDIHAHKVLAALRERPMTKAELEHWVNTEFGEAARFRTCKCQGFDLQRLLNFFLEREKVIVCDGVWTVNAEQVCHH